MRYGSLNNGSTSMKEELDYKELARDRDAIAPDGSEVRLLSETSRGSMVHCSLGPGEVSAPIAHRTVEEVWYFLEGTGLVWRKHGDEERVVDVAPDRACRSQSAPTSSSGQRATVHCGS